MPGRPLHDSELPALRQVFGSSVALDRVRLTRDHPFAVYAPKALGNTVHLRSDWGLFAGHGLELSERGRSVLVHELVHVWQYQNGGLAYIPGSLLAQHRAWLQTGARGAAYRWQGVQQAGLDFARWNPEQQAQAVQDWWDARVRAGRDDARPGDPALLATLDPIVARVREGSGAPRFSALLGR